MFADGAGGVSTSRVKFHLAGDAQPLILLPVQVSGAGSFQFILDTGAGTSLLSSELAAGSRASPLRSKARERNRSQRRRAYTDASRGAGQAAHLSGCIAERTRTVSLRSRHGHLNGCHLARTRVATRNKRRRSWFRHRGEWSDAIKGRFSPFPPDRAAKIQDLPVLIGPFLAVLSQAAGSHLDGIIAYNFLRKYEVTIDYPNQLLTLFSPC
jgi:hypothetical protein